MKKILLFLLFSIGAASAQNFVTVSGSNVQDGTGVKLASGLACFRATDNNGNPIAFRAGGGGAVISQPVCATVTTGVFSLSLANTALTQPQNVCFRASIYNNTTHQFVIGSTSPPNPARPSGYECLQPTVTNVWCISAVCSFDVYPPNLAAVPLNLTGPAATIGGSGTVTTFSSGNLSPLFTTSVATPTSTPAQTFALSNVSGHLFFGNDTGATQTPGFVAVNFADVGGTCPVASGCTGAATATADSLFGNNTGGTAAPAFSINAHLGGTLAVDGVATVASLVSNGNINASSSTGTFAAVNGGAISGTSVTSGNNITASSGTVSGNIVNAITGFTVASGATTAHYLRGNGTNFVDAAIATGDVPTLNQNTTGSAATCTGCRYTMNIMLIAGLDSGFPGTYPALGNSTGSTASPAMTYYAWTPDSNITVTRIQYRTDRAPVNCPRYAEVGFTDGTNKASITMTNGGTSGDSGAISQAFSAGTLLKLAEINGENSGSCDTIGGRTYFTVQYK